MLKLEEQSGFPREDEVEARTSEERTDHDQYGPEHEVNGHDRDRELALLRLVRWVLVDVRRQDQQDECEARQCHTSHHGVEHSEQFLQTQEVPRGLGWVRRGIEVCKLEQWCVYEDREDQQERSNGKCGHTWTVSTGADVTSWIEPDVTTVSSGWV